MILFKIAEFVAIKKIKHTQTRRRRMISSVARGAAVQPRRAHALKWEKKDTAIYLRGVKP